MNVTVNHDAAGTMYFTPDNIQIPSGNSVTVTMVPPSGASWTIVGVDSRPTATWTSNTAVLTVNDYTINIEASQSTKSGSSTLRVTMGVKEC